MQQMIYLGYNNMENELVEKNVMPFIYDFSNVTYPYFLLRSIYNRKTCGLGLLPNQEADRVCDLYDYELFIHDHLCTEDHDQFKNKNLYCTQQFIRGDIRRCRR